MKRNMFQQKQIHPMQLRKRRRLSEVAYTGFKRVRMVKKITRRDPTETFLFLTTTAVMVAAVIGFMYSCIMIAKVL